VSVAAGLADGGLEGDGGGLEGDGGGLEENGAVAAGDGRGVTECVYAGCV
jgi:hypothetical protein